MDRRILYAVVGVLAVAVVALGVELQQEREKTTGVNIDLNEHGLTIEKKGGD